MYASLWPCTLKDLPCVELLWTLEPLYRSPLPLPLMHPLHVPPPVFISPILFYILLYSTISSSSNSSSISFSSCNLCIHSAPPSHLSLLPMYLLCVHPLPSYLSSLLLLLLLLLLPLPLPLPLPL